MLNRNESKLLKDLAIAHDELVNSEIAFTDSYIGEFGEFYACKILGLKRYNRSFKGADAFDIKGKRYQIKAKVLTKSSFGYTLRGLKPDEYDYLVVVHLNERFELLGMYRVEAVLGTNQFRVTEKLIDSNNLDITENNLNSEEKEKIAKFADIYNKVKLLSFFSSSNLVGCIGEYLAAKKLNLNLSNINQKGFDATDIHGYKYEIKTRRVYNSNRRISETRRINNLVGKEYDYLVIVVLDHMFNCAGMWLLDPKKIVNAKSANLKIVNTTEDVLSVVPSRITYLKDRTPYKEEDFVKTIPENTNLKLKKKVDQDTVVLKKEKSSKKMYPAYLFVVPTMLIYYLIIKPHSSSSEGIFYYSLIALVAWYLYRKANATPKEVKLKANEITTSVFNEESLIDFRSPDRSKGKKSTLSVHKSKPGPNQLQNIQVNCECEQCMNGCDDCECLM